MFNLIDQLPLGSQTLLGSTTGPAVATGIAAPRAGFVFVGLPEGREIARLVGWVDPDVHAETVASLEVTAAKVATLEDRLALLTEIEDRLLSAYGVRESALGAEIRASRAKEKAAA